MNCRWESPDGYKLPPQRSPLRPAGKAAEAMATHLRLKQVDADKPRAFRASVSKPVKWVPMMPMPQGCPLPPSCD